MPNTPVGVNFGVQAHMYIHYYSVGTLQRDATYHGRPLNSLANLITSSLQLLSLQRMYSITKYSNPYNRVIYAYLTSHVQVRQNS
jgi:hypothetical protein